MLLDNSGPLEHTVEHLLACIDGQPYAPDLAGHR